MSEGAPDEASEPSAPPAPLSRAAEAEPAGAARPTTESDAALGRRAQILATEHWGLLAARSTAQSEVLTRITIFLTLVSAGLVTIGLLGQASRFLGWFTPAMLAILGFLCLIGFMTVLRVMNVAEEDMMYVVAMNRLRGAYVDLDPEIEQYFLASPYDDEAGMKQTYSFLRRRGASLLTGSSSMLLFVVDACVFGLFAGAIVVTAGGSVGWAIAAGVLVALALFAGLSGSPARCSSARGGATSPAAPPPGPPPFGSRDGSGVRARRQRQPLRAQASHHPAVQPLVGDVTSVGAREEDVVECAGDALHGHRLPQPQRCARDVIDDEHGVGARQLFRPSRRPADFAESSTHTGASMCRPAATRVWPARIACSHPLCTAIVCSGRHSRVHLERGVAHLALCSGVEAHIDLRERVERPQARLQPDHRRDRGAVTALSWNSSHGLFRMTATAAPA